jgi:hypothetical protein
VLFSETKIVLKGDNSAQLLDLAKKAEGAGLPNYIVHDAGRTQVSFKCNSYAKVINFKIFDSTVYSLLVCVRYDSLSEWQEIGPFNPLFHSGVFMSYHIGELSS